jgi:hypothetical protein
VDKDIAKISVKSTQSYEKPIEAGQGLPFRIKSADLKSKDASGTILFNIKTGRVENVDMSQTLEGKLSIEISGMTTDVELKQTQKTTVKTTDKDPIAPAKK